MSPQRAILVALAILAANQQSVWAQTETIQLDKRQVRATQTAPALACGAPVDTKEFAPLFEAATRADLIAYKDWIVTLQTAEKNSVSFRITVDDQQRVQIVEESSIASRDLKKVLYHADPQVISAVNDAFVLARPVSSTPDQPLAKVHALAPARWGVCRDGSDKFLPLQASDLSKRPSLEVEFTNPKGEKRMFRLEESLIAQIEPQRLKEITRHLALDEESSKQICLFSVESSSPSSLKLVTRGFDPHSQAEIAPLAGRYRQFLAFATESLAQSAAGGVERQRPNEFASLQSTADAVTAPTQHTGSPTLSEEILSLLTPSQKNPGKEIQKASKLSALNAGSFSLEAGAANDTISTTPQEIPVALYKVVTNKSHDEALQPVVLGAPQTLISSNMKRLHVLVKPAKPLDASSRYLLVLGRRVNGQIQDLKTTWFQTNDH